jgi:pilus assembly protein CpaB
MNIKKIIPALAAIVVAFIALSVLGSRESEKAEVVVAMSSFPAGHTLEEGDVALAEMPVNTLPNDALTDPKMASGETLKLARSSGDVIASGHLGGDTLELSQDERAVSIHVTDAAGLAGLVKPGDYVGVTAILNENEGAFAKVAAEGLKVLYVSPTFKALDPADLEPQAEEDQEDSFGGVNTVPERDEEGIIALAVPIQAEVLSYDFFAFGVDNETRLISLIELLHALDQSAQVSLSLFMLPDDATSFRTSGLFLPDLVITPGPSPTPTPTPLGGVPEATPMPQSGGE